MILSNASLSRIFYSSGSIAIGLVSEMNGGVTLVCIGG